MPGEHKKQTDPFSKNTPSANAQPGAPASASAGAAGPSEITHTAPEHHQRATSGDRPKVLIVEDYGPCMDAYKMALEDVQNADLYFADCGQDALDLIRKYSFAIVITDLGLPDYSGYEIKEEHHRLKPQEKPRYVLVTGYDSEEQRKKSRDLGFDEHIEKPISILRLLNLVDECTSDGDPVA